jgi:putative ABC transport system permease protein
LVLTEISETVKLAFDSIRQSKLRSFLASLGVVIGISFVILMGWILSGLDGAMQSTFNMIGADMLYVDKWDWAGGRNWKLVDQRKDITLEEYYRFKDKIKSAELVFPQMRQWGITVKYGNDYYQGLQISGTSYEQSLSPSGEVSEGRYFTQFEDEMGSDVILLGYNVNNMLFPEGGGMDKTIKVNGRKFTIIGVIRKQGTSFFDFMDNVSYIPLKSFIKSFGKTDRSISIGVKAGSEERLDEVREEAKAVMRQVRGIEPGDEEDFSINETKAFESSVASIRLYVWGVGIGMTILSFIVGIIGIMNIMFVSVTERTREIGIRKAIGAKKRSIWLQFIVESSTLCFLGAVFSFILVSLIIFPVATFLPKLVPGLDFLSPFIPLRLLIIASIVSLFVGVLSGLIPAVRAANLDPVDALRYE